jgi:hypothetical protein
MKKPSRKSVAWYQQELRNIQRIADETLEQNQSGPVWDCAERQGIALVAIAALAECAADGREIYLETTDEERRA